MERTWTNWEVGLELGNGNWEMQNREVEEVGCGKGNGKRDVELEDPPFLHPATNKSGERRAKSYLGAWGGKYFGECHFLYQLAPPISNSNPLVGPQEQPTPDHDHQPHRTSEASEGWEGGVGGRGFELEMGGAS